ncbi:DNA-3-methyladenine glycosidase [Devosia pacifica]|uniref:DNA-3-methyladenine glycosylase II n=1 Tax=Devosia pacifica TaxID=1335967 RepID=A0A918VSX6_9HYPH|nr:DNA-3-methyladenine glycosylase [Devosia pacifica]GHA26120.1 DNA-3-methyladenine glycosidase [Devosia pacifica]
MSRPGPTTRLDSVEAIREHLDALAQRDPRLERVIAMAGEVAPRMTPPGFAGMAKVICGQQLSVASARAIWARFEAVEGALDPHSFLELDDAVLRATGFSAGKIRTVRAIAEAVRARKLDFDEIERLSADEAVARLTEHKGIGPWTAEIYLMFCAGHPDVFPAGDLALQKAVAHGLGLDARPGISHLIEIAKPWSPHRAAAALLFWRYFAVLRDREGLVL